MSLLAQRGARLPTAVALALVWIAALALSGCGPLSRDELARSTGTVEAVAAEGGVLAHQVALDRTKDNFVRVHADDLIEQSDHIVEKLREADQEGDIPGDLLAAANDTVSLAQDASDALESLRLNPGDPQTGEDAESKLTRTADDAGALEGEL